jgi:hypothetical protein
LETSPSGAIWTSLSYRKILKEIGVKYGADVVQPPGGTGWKADVGRQPL